jgi:hypothetical protein
MQTGKIRRLVTVHHEPIMHDRRTGCVTEAHERGYRLIHTEGFVRRLAKLGFTHLRMHVYKGYGLKAEREEFEKAKQAFAYARKYGMGVGVYFQFANYCHETLRFEEPDCLDWAMRYPDGTPAPYCYEQNYRYYACLNADGWIRYVQRALDQVMTELRPEFLGVDNGEGFREHFCYCHRCLAGFREFLREKYTPAQAKSRYGWPDLRYVVPPSFTPYQPERVRWLNQRELIDPAVQDWLAYRNRCFYRTAQEFFAHARRIRPDVEIGANIHLGHNLNVALVYGVDCRQVPAEIDRVNFGEAREQPGIDKSGLLVSYVPAHALGEAIGVKGGSGGEVGLWESCAFAGDLSAGAHAHPVYRGEKLFFETEAFRSRHKLVTPFIEKYGALLNGNTSLARTAVYWSYATLTYNFLDGHHGMLALERILQAAHIPYAKVLDSQLDRLKDYALVVLPEVRCLSQAERRALQAYVAGGGRLLLTGGTGAKDEYAHDFMHNPLRRMLGVQETGRVVKVGRGCVLWLEDMRRDMLFPEIYEKDPHGCMRHPNYSMDSIHGYSLSPHWEPCAVAIRELLGEENDLMRVDAPSDTLSSLRRLSNGKTSVHLLRYAEAPEAAEVRVSILAPRARKAVRLSPYDLKPRTVALQREGKRACFSDRMTGRYSVYVLD